MRHKKVHVVFQSYHQYWWQRTWRMRHKKVYVGFHSGSVSSAGNEYWWSIIHICWRGTTVHFAQISRIENFLRVISILYKLLKIQILKKYHILKVTHSGFKCGK
jgi:hypothetical protein